jgi:uncharacterized protein (DUF4415 family)
MKKQQKTPPIQINEDITIGRLEDEFSKSEVEQFDADAELWESGKLGASAEHARPASPEQEQALDDALGLQLISIRIQKPLIEKLRGLAKLEGMGYQTFMRQILTHYARENEHKLELLLMPNQLAEKAEQLLRQALKYKGIVPTLKPMSNERISAECDYSVTLGKANELFCQAHEKCKEPV